MILSVVYAVVRRLLEVPGVLLRRDTSKDAELLVLRHENAVLRRQVARVRYEPADRLWPAALSCLIPRCRWVRVFAVSPATILAWHRSLVARKWDYGTRSRRPGRPSTRAEVKHLALRPARENSRWGHRRIQGELARLGYPIAASTVWEILNAAGIEPAPRRSGPTRRRFLHAQAIEVIACDFLHVDCVMTLKRIYILVFIEHGTRRLHIAGASAHPTAEWVTQQAGNLSVDLDSRMEETRFLIRDRDTKFTRSFDAVFEAEDVEILKSPPRAPRANAVCERIIGTLRRELFDHVLVYKETHALALLRDYTEHYNEHRPHQSRQQLPPGRSTQPATATTAASHRIRRRSVLGGLINEYHQAA
ncbi:integrase core domain-containing protein [Embleya scabrispora]|uniref:integrase core domain-containing protein n=1 Tax=Embleya scabrispora TaxID=159449 RepID=UPI0003A1E8AC|nr:integrase core domain-containing protein [Embleya scabrispora]MYS80170.1 transposase [Streptomyces sp. SID5474]